MLTQEERKRLDEGFEQREKEYKEDLRSNLERINKWLEMETKSPFHKVWQKYWNKFWRR